MNTDIAKMSAPQLRALREKIGKAIDAYQELFASLTKELQRRKDPVFEAETKAETKAVFRDIEDQINLALYGHKQRT